MIRCEGTDGEGRPLLILALEQSEVMALTRSEPVSLADPEGQRIVLCMAEDVQELAELLGIRQEEEN